MRGKRHVGLAQWVERNIVLPDTVAEPGKMKLWPWQRGIAEAITDPGIERITLLKPARVGFSSLLTAALGYFATEQPSSVLYLLPTEADCRGFVVDDCEPMFEASPTLRDVLKPPSVASRDRNTMTHRLYPGGSLKIVAGKAPRNLRRHTARILMVDECDAIEVSAEGDPIGLAERRTMTFGDRKIVVGGTPLDAETSHVLRCYRESDMRQFEVPCPACGVFTFIEWRHIEWEADQPSTARFRCPDCSELINEKHKPAMVLKGRWRATEPEVEGHAGFRLNSLVSLLPTTSWPKLAAEFLRVRDDPTRLKVFVNTLLGEAWRGDDEQAYESDLATRAEPFGLDDMPAAVLAITAGVDVQEDRVEVSLVGHAMDGVAFVLDHRAIHGAPNDSETWSELDGWLQTRWRHPHGGQLGVDAAVIDAGSGGHFDTVLRFCAARSARRVLAGKGVFGMARPAITPSRTKRGRLWIIGVDNIKSQIFARLAKGRSIRFSQSLQPVYFEMLASERRIVRYVRGRPVARFERIPGKRAESLDALVYALAARASMVLNFGERADAMRGKAAPQQPAFGPAAQKPPETAFRSQWMQRQSLQWSR